MEAWISFVLADSSGGIELEVILFTMKRSVPSARTLGIIVVTILSTKRHLHLPFLAKVLIVFI